MNNKLWQFYKENETQIEEMWEYYCIEVYNNSSGEDQLRPFNDDKWFWEFVEDLYYSKEAIEV